MQKLIGLPIENSIIERTVIQLEVLSKLRKLQLQIIEQLNTMALTYNIEEDVRFQQGKEENAKETILEMFNDGFPIDKIAKYARVTVEFVKEVIKQIKK